MIDGKSVVVGGPRLVAEDKQRFLPKLRKQQSAGHQTEKQFCISSLESECSVHLLLKTRSDLSRLRP